MMDDTADRLRYAAMAEQLRAARVAQADDALVRRRLAHLHIEPVPPVALVNRPPKPAPERRENWALLRLHIDNASNPSALAR